MKTASVQHLNTIAPNRIYASYQLDLSNLTNINTYIMKKLTSVSPFLLLLIPVFMMMVFTITTGLSADQQNEISMKSKPHIEVVKITDQLAK